MLLLAARLAEAAPVEVTDVGWAFVDVFALDAGDGVVLVDTHYEGHEDRILRRLHRHGVEPDAIRLILLTHGHADHAGSAAALRDELHVPVAAGAADEDKLAEGHMHDIPFTGGRGKAASVLIHKTFPPFAPDLAIPSRLDLAPYGIPGGEARIVGGHTPGSLVVTLPDHVALTGDLFRTHLVRRHTPTLHFVQEDAVRAHAVLDGLVAEGFTTFYPSHGGVVRAADLERWLAGRRHRDEARMARRASR